MKLGTSNPAIANPSAQSPISSIACGITSSITRPDSEISTKPSMIGSIDGRRPPRIATSGPSRNETRL